MLIDDALAPHLHTKSLICLSRQSQSTQQSGASRSGLLEDRSQLLPLYIFIIINALTLSAQSIIKEIAVSVVSDFPPIYAQTGLD